MTPSNRRGAKGFTLVEVVIASMVLAIGATAVFAVALSTRRTMAVSPYREQMNQYGRRLVEDLKSYVTHDLSATGNLATMAPGGPGDWSFPGDTCGGWALNTGCTHSADSLLPPSLRATPSPDAHLSYEVTLESKGGQMVRKIAVTMKWTEPD